MRLTRGQRPCLCVPPPKWGTGAQSNSELVEIKPKEIQHTASLFAQNTIGADADG